MLPGFRKGCSSGEHYRSVLHTKFSTDTLSWWQASWNLAAKIHNYKCECKFLLDINEDMKIIVKVIQVLGWHTWIGRKRIVKRREMWFVNEKRCCDSTPQTAGGLSRRSCIHGSARLFHFWRETVSQPLFVSCLRRGAAGECLTKVYSLMCFLWNFQNIFS